MLRENLAIGIEAQESVMDAARPATSPVELAGWLSLTLLSAAALLRRMPRRVQMESPASAVAPVDDYYVPVPADDGPAAIRLHDAVARLARQRLAASVAAAKVAKRNNERQIELARSWNVPVLNVVPASRPTAEMGVYEEDTPDIAPRYGALSLVGM
jgi:hypothetical protein